MEGKKHVLDRALKGGYIKKENALHIDCKVVICLKKKKKKSGPLKSELFLWTVQGNTRKIAMIRISPSSTMNGDIRSKAFLWCVP